MARLEQKLVQKQTLTPQQILQASLLQLNSINLEARILEELETNPVLEPLDPDPAPETEEPREEDNPLDIPDDFEEYEPPNLYPQPKEQQDLPLPEQKDCIDSLLDQLNLFDLTEEERHLAEEILWNLDDRGYLAVDLELIADRYDLTVDDLVPILDVIHQLDPPGIGARDLRECLLIQLMEEQDTLAWQIVHDCYDDLVHKRYEAIQKKTNCTRDELAVALDRIAHLNPKPGEGLAQTRSDVIIPDLIVREQDGHWIIQNNDSGIPELRVNPDYIAMMEEQGETTGATKKYIKERIDSANWFIQAIRQRRQTMRNVMRVIIERQPEFFQGQIHRLRPMKLQDIADELGMDISTISRSTRGKYVDTPYGVFELKSFFTEGMTFSDGRTVSNHQIKQALKQLIEQEDKHHPWNDEQLVQELKKVGYPVARRTVAKYREQLGFPVARLRRQL
ncbi:MAG: RNA polymerase sigma-54 factor [Candidatus Neomarinimicrobiota bacterium]|nr:MAG: RNA polymerase sigma-54 factor [Candidatus Neomarinimicrobiota bacterium]